MSAPIRVEVETDDATQDLWRLAETEDTDQLERILARGADINASNGDGVTALVRAAYYGRLHMVRALIDHGADINAKRNDGFTALGLAAFFGHTDVVRVLVERGADLSEATPLGTSAEMWATARSFYGLAHYLEEARSGTNESAVGPSHPENQPGDEVTTAEPVRVEQPTPADSDVTMETPRIVFSDQLISQHLEESPGTGQENNHASAAPPVVRTLKNPPEIWDLVRETPVNFNARGAFVSRLTSRKTNFVLMTLAVVLISGLCAFAVMTLRDGGKRDGAAAHVPEERGTSQTVPASQASAPASAPVDAQLNASPVNTSPGAADSIDNTSPPPGDPHPTDAHADNPASDRAALTNNIQPTGVTVSNISKQTATIPGTAAALSGNKSVTVAADSQNSDNSRAASGESETAAGPETRPTLQTPQTPQPANVKESQEKSPSDSASAKKRSDTTLSPQLIAPSTTTSAPKGKVIQWP